ARQHEGPARRRRERAGLGLAPRPIRGLRLGQASLRDRDQPQLRGRLLEELAQPPTEVRAGQGDAALPATDVDGRGPDPLGQLLLRPSPPDARGRERRVRNGVRCFPGQTRELPASVPLYDCTAFYTIR